MFEKKNYSDIILVPIKINITVNSKMLIVFENGFYILKNNVNINE